MLAPGNYVKWKSRIKRYIDAKPNSELIHYCLQNPPYTYQWAEKTVPVAEGSSKTTTERYMENYKNVSQDIRDQLNAEAEAVQIILTGIYNDIYFTVDACPNACEIGTGYDNQRAVNVAVARENVGIGSTLYVQAQLQEVTPDRCNNLGTIFVFEPMHKNSDDQGCYDDSDQERDLLVL
ncbi:hypothetical protein Tco_0739412 [Tanacetum coccineum]